MKAGVKNIKESDFKPILFMTLCIVAFLAVIYVVAANRIKKAIIGSIDNIGNNYVEFSYEDIKISVYPFFIKTKLSNVKVNAGIKGRESIRFIIDEIATRSIIFSKDIDVKLPEKIKIILNGSVENEIAIGENYISASLDKKYSLKDVDVFVSSMKMTNEENENVVLSLENTTFKLIKLFEEDYTNTTTRFNVDKISAKIIDKNFENESNMEIIISSVKEYDSTRDVVSVSNVVDTFNYSDITNNYAFNIHGSYSAGKLDRNISVDLELEIANYNYLVSALNSKEDFYFINKPKLSNFVQLLELVPANEKNTKNNRYYKIIGDSSNKKFLLNNEDFNNIVKRVFYRNNM